MMKIYILISGSTYSRFAEHVTLHFLFFDILLSLIWLNSEFIDKITVSNFCLFISFLFLLRLCYAIYDILYLIFAFVYSYYRYF